MPRLRSIPAVEKVLQALGDLPLPRPLVVTVVRRALAGLRQASAKAHSGLPPTFDTVTAQIRSTLEILHRSRLQPVINGTGILVHTNLGRAPLGVSAVQALQQVGAAYTNLEIDLIHGDRGGRASYVEHALAVLSGAEAATVVNNCAAALVLILRHFTAGERKEVLISRGELVQIGGGFRIPEILEASGARLREVGTTNRTALGDYARAIDSATALLLKVHRSNFFMGGFVTSPSSEELGVLARKKRVPLVEDLGSGAVVSTEKLAGLEHEPTPWEELKRGVQLVCFSGDKLLGGPQAGIIAGQGRRVAALKRDPLFRALRCDKLTLAALQATADNHLEAASLPSTAERSAIPILSLLQTPLTALQARAERIVAALADRPGEASVGRGEAQMGGGTLPRSVIASATVDLLPQGQTLAQLAAKLRLETPPVIGYLGGGRFKLDLRTVFPTQDAELTRILQACLAPPNPGGTASQVPGPLG